MAKNAPKFTTKTEIELSKLGHVAFLTGIILAIVVGLLSENLEATTNSAIAVTLVILGLIVGVLNITVKEMTEFLVAVITLLVASVTVQFIFGLPYVGVYLRGVLVYVSIFVAPAGLVVAIKAIYELASRR